MSSLFGDAEVTGSVRGFQVTYGALDWEEELLDFLSGGLGGLDYSTTGTAVIFGDFSDLNPVPEPATLAMIGPGLAGLGLARRRQRMRATAA